MTGSAGDGLEAVVDAYVEAWNEDDDQARALLLEQAVTDDCSFAGPLGAVEGREALAAQIVDARDFVPGAVVTRVGPVEQGRAIRFRWRIEVSSGAALAEGVDVVELSDDGRLARITVTTSSD